MDSDRSDDDAQGQQLIRMPAQHLALNSNNINNNNDGSNTLLTEGWAASRLQRQQSAHPLLVNLVLKRFPLPEERKINAWTFEALLDISISPLLLFVLLINKIIYRNKQNNISHS